MTSLGRNVRTLVQASRLFSGSAARNEVHPVYFKHKELQKKCRENVHKPVHELGGKVDILLRYFTYALMVGVIVEAGRTIYILARPPK